MDARVLPSLSDAIFICLFIPFWLFLLVPILHRIYRPITHLISTERILAVEPSGKLYEIGLEDIAKMRGTKTSLMVYGTEGRLCCHVCQTLGFSSLLSGTSLKKLGFLMGRPVGKGSKRTCGRAARLLRHGLPSERRLTAPGPLRPLKLKPNAAMQLPQSGRPPLEPSRIGSG